MRFDTKHVFFFNFVNELNFMTHLWTHPPSEKYQNRTDYCTIIEKCMGKNLNRSEMSQEVAMVRD